MVIRLIRDSDGNIIPGLSGGMVLQETHSIKLDEVSPTDGGEAVKERLRNLLKLAVAIGTREGLLRRNGEHDAEGGKYVANKRC